MKCLETINERWVKWVRNLSVIRLVGASEIAYAAAIALRPDVGPAGEFARWSGLSGLWLAAIFVLFGIPAVVKHLHIDWFWVVGWPLTIYLVFSFIWSLTESGTYTAIAANGSVVVIFYYLAVRVAYGNHDNG